MRAINTREKAEEVRRTSLCVLKGVLPRGRVDALRRAFAPLLERAVAGAGDHGNRGPGRHYVTLPFASPWTDPELIDNETVMGIVSDLVGADGAFGEYASDTPLQGSEHQALHRDTGPLFPETKAPTPPYQVAVNVPLVDVTADNGPMEVVEGSHVLSDAEALARLEAGDAKLTPVYLEQGDVLIRDVRHLHRGTPNPCPEPRPILVLGFHRRWFARPDLEIVVPRDVWQDLSPRARQWLRFARVVDAAPGALIERTILPPGVRSA